MKNTKDISLNAMLLALVCVSSFISVPVPILPVPISATTMAMVLVAFSRPAKDTFLIISLFILIELLNLPIVAGGSTKIFGPSGGYQLGFLIAFPFLALLLEKKRNLWMQYLLSLLVTLPIIYGLGSFYMAFLLNQPLGQTLFANLIFLPGDAIKYFLALLIAQQIASLRN